MQFELNGKEGVKEKEGKVKQSHSKTKEEKHRQTDATELSTECMSCFLRRPFGEKDPDR
jgi:hypothetical protein